MIAVDLFCGAGGASLGLHWAGYEVVGYDYWSPAVDTHNANGLPAHLHDLARPELDDLLWMLHPTGATPDLLWASPPCQPFSAAGDGEGEFDDRDGFPWTLRIIGKLLPPVVIIENVKGLTFDKHRAYFGGILDQLRALGYAVQWRVLNSADYGVPQTRERCFIIARRDGGPITWPAPTHTEGDSLFLEPWVTMAQALGWGMTNRPAFTIPAREADGGPRMDGVGGSGARAAMYAERDAGRWILDHRQTGGDGTPVIVDVTDRPSPTVGTMAANQWIINETIRLTIAELATLQGFPADWKWTGTKTAQARQVGNAVPPIMAQVLAEANRPVR